ncbi:hypothetical protein [Mucilaginibacter sp. KACC 22063]|uniref:hypothetical protein n=1 Tax=Mucilaginibacter sp. KACC 22063 TaxID=3025666 RepID=UPI002365F3C0|nr:hypothetical protein [Mucilaginibacter sp. KACC 22063]WDF54353.1 hypothetical protein PQ461_15520 [Mucilaginibacter sp. KACC 22063]
MDTTLWPYRLKSARRKKQLQKKNLDKQLLHTERELKRLQDIKSNQPLVPLDKPYQKGWVRKFVLRPEIQKSEKAEFYQEILDKINSSQRHYDQSFKQPKRNKHRHRYHYTSLPELRTISRHDWIYNKLELSEEQRDCFRRVEFWDEQWYRWDYKYAFAKPELFEIAVLPYMVDKIKLGDAILEQEIDHLNYVLYESRLMYRFSKIKGRCFRYRWDEYENPKYLNPLKNIPLNKIKNIFTEIS